MTTNSVSYLADFHKSLGDLEYDFRNKNLIKLVASYIKGSSILDIGCGSGALLRLLKLEGKTVCGVEPNTELVNLAKQLDPHLNIYNTTAGDLDVIKSPIFDTITMLDVLEHIEDDDVQLKMIYHKLSKGGQFVFVVPACPLLYGERDKNSGHYRRYSKKQILLLLKKNNFQVRKIRFWNWMGMFPYFFYEKILRKEITTACRHKPTNPATRMLNFFLENWFRYVENNVNFGLGLSIVCVAERKCSDNRFVENT